MSEQFIICRGTYERKLRLVRAMIREIKRHPRQMRSLSPADIGKVEWLWAEGCPPFTPDNVGILKWHLKEIRAILRYVRFLKSEFLRRRHQRAIS